MTPEQLREGAALLAACKDIELPSLEYTADSKIGMGSWPELDHWLRDHAAKLLADAARYQWLRDPRHCDAIGDAFDDDDDTGWAERLDAAIDAAIAAATPDKGGA